MRMRQSLSEFEQAFDREASLDRHRRDSLWRAAERRMHKRTLERRQRRGSLRFVVLVLALILTAAVVIAVMFRTLYLLLG